MQLRQQHQHFDGTTEFYTHDSVVCNAPMNFAVFRPPGAGQAQQAPQAPYPILYFLSGLTCTEENFTLKSGAQRLAAELGVFLVIPDTTPRGLAKLDHPSREDLGAGAGYYLDATQAPWAEHYQMYSYVTDELPKLIHANFPVDASRESICGHSMGGHGALVAHLRQPGRYQSVSVLAPVAAPTQRDMVPAAFIEYLGNDRELWQQYDATALVKKHGSSLPIWLDQGMADPILPYLLPDVFAEACADAGVKLQYTQREGYDHAYFFISSFIEDHVRYHAEALYKK